MNIIDEELLGRKYNLTKWDVRSGTQISSRVSAVVSTLTGPAAASEKTTIVSLTAPAKTATKLISIVEITKRDLTAKGIECFQYNALTSCMIEIDRRPEDGDDEKEAFETMEGAEPPSSSKKRRNVPVLTIYLARTFIKELRMAYDEQR